jgi:radical SAM protein with 4Fe4S-binding SPASM domain
MSTNDRQYNQVQISNNIQNKNLFLDNHPSQIHLLMIDKCNAKCIMCGGNYFSSKSGKRITIEDYKKIAGNIEFDYVSAVALAGAGDPLLNHDTIPIIKYTNQTYPHLLVSITTNGIALTKQTSQKLLEHNITMVNISINSASRETFKKIMQVDAFDIVCENARYLTELTRSKGRGPALQLSFVANRLNIEELPNLVELACSVGAKSINFMYCRFYPERMRSQGVRNKEERLLNKDSLFFHQELSDTMVLKAKELAKNYGIMFTHEPLFMDNAQPQSCTWAYTQLMVGFSGEIYPCGGAEVHFKNKVESGRYNFGNAIHEPLEKFWNNEHYQALRLSSQQGETCLMPECRNCANLMSPNDIRSHIMEWEESEYVWDGEELFSKGDIEGAIEAFSEALRINPGYAEAYNNLGVAYWKKGDNQRALDNLSKAIELDPDAPDAYLNIGEVLISLEKDTEARDLLRKYLENHPTCQQVTDALARIGQPSHPLEPVMRTSIEGPLVSVIIPTYNRPDMVKDTIRSILSQTFQDFEIVVVNDCGQEIEPIITELNKDVNKILYVRHSKNRGLAAARNTGIMAARGKYIAYLDDDDIYYPDHFETLVGFLKNSTYKIAYTDAHRAVMKKKDGKYQVVYRDLPYSFDFDYDRILWDNFVPVLCFMHEKACLDDVGMFDEDLHTLEDWDLWIRMSRQFKLAHIKKVTAEFSWRMDGTTMSTTQLPNFYKSLKRITSKYRQYAADRPDILQKQHELLEGRKQSVLAHEENEKKKVSIIILCWNQLKYTKLCLKSIEKYTSSPHELILVDNGSTDDTRKFLEGYARTHPHVQLILNDQNLGFSVGNNQAIEKATGDYILFLNNDVVVTKGWLDRMKKHMLLHPAVGMVGPMSNYVAGTQQVETTYGNDLNKMQEFAVAFAEEHPGEVTRVARLIGFCLLVKKGVLDLIGGFDPNYKIGCFEDDDICLRSTITGHIHIQAGDVFIHHFGSVTLKGSSIDIHPLLLENQKYFHSKWGHVLVRDGMKFNIIPMEQNVDLFVNEITDWGEKEFEKGNLNQAILLFERALQIRPNHARAINNLGVIQWQLGYTVSAINIFQNALAINPKDPDALGNLIRAAAETDRFDLIGQGQIDILRQSQPEHPDLMKLINAQQDLAITT